jgi:hypothetical protein
MGAEAASGARPSRLSGPAGREPYENTVEVGLTDGTTRRYGLGDASAFLLPGDWMDLTETRRSPGGNVGRPRLEITGSTGREGRRFSFLVTLDFDPGPRGTRQAPYGFRYTSGTLTGPGATYGITDPFFVLDTIARGEEAFAAAP